MLMVIFDHWLDTIFIVVLYVSLVRFRFFHTINNIFFPHRSNEMKEKFTKFLAKKKNIIKLFKDLVVNSVSQKVQFF